MGGWGVKQLPSRLISRLAVGEMTKPVNRFSANCIEAALIGLIIAWNENYCTDKQAKNTAKAIAIALNKWADERLRRGKKDLAHQDETHHIERVLRHWLFEFQKATHDNWQLDEVHSRLQSVHRIEAAGEFTRYGHNWGEVVQLLAEFDAVE